MKLKYLLILILLFFPSCTIARGGGRVVHTVGKGETLWRISYTYGVDLKKVARANNIKDPARIKAGARIFIPGAKRVRKIVPYSGPASIEKNPALSLAADKGRFLWPVKGRISSRFGVRGGKLHDGIDIRAPRGTSVKAADKGSVVYVSEDFRKYGRIIILKHTKNYFTVYAHNKNNLVKLGEAVSRGERIATVGRSGNATGNHLHFEVRKGRKVIDPLFFLQ
jgi:lipoprotein NlpD